MVTKKDEGMLTALARTVGTTAGVIVAKASQLKAEVAKVGSATRSRPSAKKLAKKGGVKKTMGKKNVTKRRTPRASVKKKTKKSIR